MLCVREALAPDFNPVFLCLDFCQFPFTRRHFLKLLFEKIGCLFFSLRRFGCGFCRALCLQQHC